MSISESTMSLKGYLVHPDGTGISKRSLRLVSENGWYWNPSIIAETRTKSSGKFKFILPINSEKTEKEKRAVIEVFEPKTKREGTGERRVAAISVTYPTQSSCTLERLVAELYEFEEGLPIQKLPSNAAFTPQQPSYQFLAHLVGSALIPKVKEFIADTAELSTQQVQSLYPYNNKSLSPEQVIDIILNGVDPVLFSKGKNGELIHKISWEGIDADYQADLYDAEIALHEEEGKLKIAHISITYPGEQRATATPNDNYYNRFLQLFASMAIVEGEIKEHLGKGHIYVGFVSIGFFRCISKENPLYKLLGIHLFGVEDINQLGAGLIFGPTGVLNESGVSPLGITQGLQKTLAAMDYETFSPREPINEEHKFAQAGKLYWDNVVAPTIDQFFKEHAEIMSEEWLDEIRAMSECLHKASVPREAPKGSKADWFNTTELCFDEQGFETYKGSLKSFKPIIQGDGNDIDRLKKFCCHLLYFSTFWHSTVHNRQSIDLTNLKIASLAPRNHALNESGKWDIYAHTQPKSAAKQLAVAGALTTYNGTKLVDSENDVYPPLVQNLKAQEINFVKIGYKIGDIMTCVEI